jgi:tripartite-type tricarboxylate transporter receptor subunit TctC
MVRLLAIAVIMVVSGVADAQTNIEQWPTRPIELIVPFPAGSGTDVAARILSQKLGERLKQSIVINNRPGASGTLGSEMVAKAAPDGYTFGIATASTHAVAPNMEPKPRYDAIRDFSPVAMLGASPYVLVVYPGLKIADVPALIALAKQKPGALNYGSAGSGSLAHLATALFAQMAGIELTHIPYKASASSLSDLISGRLDMQLSTIAPMLSNIESGNLKAVAVSGKQRVSALPHVPTFIEAGVAGYEAALWMMIVGPAGLPPSIIARMNKEVNDMLRSDVGAALVDQGMQLEVGTPSDASARIRDDLVKWKAAVAATAHSR